MAEKLSPWEDYKGPKVDLPIPAVVETDGSRAVQTGINAGFVAMTAFVERCSNYPIDNVANVAVVGASRGNVAYALLAQFKCSFNLYLYEDEPHMEACGRTKSALASDNRHPRLRSIHVVGLDKEMNPPKGGVLYDFVVFVSNVHILQATIKGWSERVVPDGAMWGVYGDARVARNMGVVAGFQHVSSDRVGSTVKIFGKEYYDPVFDPPHLPGFSLFDVGHREFCCHNPWAVLVPRRMRIYSRSPLARYYRIVLWKRGLVELIRPPVSFKWEKVAKNRCSPSDAMVRRHELIEAFDPAVGCTYQDLRHIMGSRHFFKDKYDGEPFLMVVNRSGRYLWEVGREDMYFLEGKEAAHGFQYIYQYEFVKGIMKLCSLNVVKSHGEYYPFNFEQRQRLYDNAWFESTWRPLKQLRLPLSNEEGLVLCSATSLSPSYRHQDESGKTSHVGASMWVKRVPTVDVETAFLKVFEVPLLELLGGEKLTWWKERPNKPPNDGLRIEQLTNLIPIELLAAIAPVNGASFPSDSSKVNISDLEEFSKTLQFDTRFLDPEWDFSTSRAWGGCVKVPVVVEPSELQRCVDFMTFDPKTGQVSEDVLDGFDVYPEQGEDIIALLESDPGFDYFSSVLASGVVDSIPEEKHGEG